MLRPITQAQSGSMHVAGGRVSPAVALASSSSKKAVSPEVRGLSSYNQQAVLAEGKPDSWQAQRALLAYRSHDCQVEHSSWEALGVDIYV